MSQRPLHMPSLLLGAALVAVGYFFGSTQSEKAAYAQTTVTGSGFFVSGNPAIITSSADGKSLYFWSASLLDEVLNDANKPKYVGSVTAQQ
jgi:hypothetical protein